MSRLAVAWPSTLPTLSQSSSPEASLVDSRSVGHSEADEDASGPKAHPIYGRRPLKKLRSSDHLDGCVVQERSSRNMPSGSPMRRARRRAWKQGEATAEA